MGNVLSIVVAVVQILATMIEEILKRKREAEANELRQAILADPVLEFKRRYGVRRGVQGGVQDGGDTEAATPDTGESKR